MPCACSPATTILSAGRREGDNFVQLDDHTRRASLEQAGQARLQAHTAQHEASLKDAMAATEAAKHLIVAGGRAEEVGMVEGLAAAPMKFPWDEAFGERRVCTNECTKARDGHCDDGRSGRGQVWLPRHDIFTLALATHIVIT